MKISDVRVYVMGSAWRNFVFARVRTDEGLEGIGEARPVNREEAVAAYVEAITHRYVLGSDPFNIEDLASAARPSACPDSRRPAGGAAS